MPKNSKSISKPEEYKMFFGELCLQNSNIHKITTSYLPQQNDIAEYKNWTLKEMMNVMLVSSSTPFNL